MCIALRSQCAGLLIHIVLSAVQYLQFLEICDMPISCSKTLSDPDPLINNFIA